MFPKITKIENAHLPVDKGGLAVDKVSSSSAVGLGTIPLPNESSENDGIEAVRRSSALLG